MRIFEPSVENFSFIPERDFRRAGSVRLIRQNLSFLRDNIHFQQYSFSLSRVTAVVCYKDRKRRFVVQVLLRSMRTEAHGPFRKEN